MRATAAVRLILSALAGLGFADPAAAEPQIFGLNVEGDVEAGFRGFPEQPSSQRRAKFEEYRDFPAERPFLDQLRLRFFRPDESYSSELAGSKWGQRDQEFSLTTGRLGLWQLEFGWDQTPHIFSTNARMLATEAARGVFTLPAVRPNLSAYNTAPRLDEISTRWDTARISLLLTPTPDLEFKAEYTRIKKDGDRPMSVPFGSPGNNFMEVLEPIEQLVHDFRIKGTIAREQWQLQFGYTLSMFQNGQKSLTADNPCFANAAACGASDGGAAAPATGLVSLAPSNMAHTVNLAGGVNLPMRTRLTFNGAYSLRLQDESFLPHTINSMIADPTGALTLPARNLDGMVGITLFNLNLTSRPLRPLTLSFKYRLFDHNDMTDELLFPGRVVDDRTLDATPRLAGRYGYTRHNADLDTRWRVAEPLALTLGAGWEHWDRNKFREVSTSNETFGKAAFDLTPFDWLQAKLTYRPSFRRTLNYFTLAHALHTQVEEDPTVFATSAQLPGLRKYDEGERNRQQLDLLLQLTPTDAFTTTVTTGWRFDDYLSSPIGLQTETGWSGGIDFTWNPVERLSFYAGYVYELNFQRQKQNNRPFGVTTEFADFDWISDNTDVVNTFRLGGTVVLIPRVLDWTFGANYSQAVGQIETRNRVQPTSGSASQNATATAKRMPAFEDALFSLETALQYHFWKNWTASLRYVFESFEKTDWRTDTLNPFMPGVTSIYLGNDLKNYTAHILAFTVGYRFK